MMDERYSFGIESALNLMFLAGSVSVKRSPSRAFNEISSRTAASLERRGLADRVYTGGDAGMLVLTEKGRRVASDLPDFEYDQDAPADTVVR